jgi:hypothetical protein
MCTELDQEEYKLNSMVICNLEYLHVMSYRLQISDIYLQLGIFTCYVLQVADLGHLFPKVSK